MITAEERESIIEETIERILLKLPEAVGNLMMHQANLTKINRDFYKANPDFKNSKALVAAVVENVESKNPGLDYEKILELAIPKIKEQMKVTRKLDTVSVSRPSRQLQIDISGNGEL